MRLALESLYHETPQLLQSKGALKLSKKYLSNMMFYARNGVRGLKPYEFQITHTVYTGAYGIYMATSNKNAPLDLWVYTRSFPLPIVVHA